MQKNQTIIAQTISGGLKFLAITTFFLVIIIVIIPFFLSVIKGKDIPPVDDSKLQLQVINIPDADNAFYDLDKTRDLININNIPKGKNLATDYLKSDEWDQAVVKKLLDDNDKALQYFTDAATKSKFQLPDANHPAKISRDMPVTPLNNWREASRLSSIKAIWLARNGEDKAALDEALKSIAIGNAIENSQGLLITYLVGIGIKDTGLDTLQKVIAMIPRDSSVLEEYKLKLANYQAIGNATPFVTEYLISKQAWNNLERDDNNQFGLVSKILIKNKFYFKKNLTISYYFDFYNKLAVEAEKDCFDSTKVQVSAEPRVENGLIKMYFTENLIGKYSTYIPELALNNALEKKCATENKLKETILMMSNSK